MSVYSKSQKDNVIGAELQSILGGYKWAEEEN